MNQQINWSNQLRSLQEKQRNEYNQVMANMQSQYQQQVQALQQQFNPYSQMQQAQAITQPTSVQPSPEEQSVPQTESPNMVPLQQLAMLAEMKNLLAEMRDTLNSYKATTEISTEAEPAQVEAAPVSETKAKANKPIKSE